MSINPVLVCLTPGIVPLTLKMRSPKRCNTEMEVEMRWLRNLGVKQRQSVL